MFSVMLILLVYGCLDGCGFVCTCIYPFTYVLYVSTSVCLRLTHSSFFHSAYHSCDNNFFSWAVQNHCINHKHSFSKRPCEHNWSWITGRKQRDETTSSSFDNQNSSCNKYFSPAREILRSIRRKGDKVASDTKGNDGWTTMSQGNERYFLWNTIHTCYILFAVDSELH